MPPVHEAVEGEAVATRIIADGLSNFSPTTSAQGLARSLTALGDLNGNGSDDFAAGADGSDPLAGAGEVWIVMLRVDGSVQGQQRIAQDAGGFTGALDTQDRFGASVATLGDLDGDGITELAVGAPGDDDGIASGGAVYVLFLNADGTVKAQQEISNTGGGMAGLLAPFGNFGIALDAADIDADGDLELAVGAPGFGPGAGGTPVGGVWILDLATDGTVTPRQYISQDAGGMPFDLFATERFGAAVRWLPDLDGDGRPELAVGAHETQIRGVTWVLLLDADDAVKSAKRLGHGLGGVPDPGTAFGEFGQALAWLGTGAGTARLAVGDSHAAGGGEVWLLDLGTRAWTDLGFDLAGILGQRPVLAGTGDLSPGSDPELNLTWAQPNSTAWLVVGFDTAYVPLNGGVLVPSVAPPALVLPVPTGATLGGGTTLAATWPIGVPSGLEMFLQAWVVDPAGPYGFSASNGLLGHAP